KITSICLRLRVKGKRPILIYRSYQEPLTNKATKLFTLEGKLDINKERQNNQPFSTLHIFICINLTVRTTSKRWANCLYGANDFFLYGMKIIKKGHTYPIYSVYTNRAFERIQLLVQS